MPDLNTAKLFVEVQPTTNPKPMGIAVVKDGKPIAFVTLEDFKKAAADLERLEAARK